MPDPCRHLKLASDVTPTYIDGRDQLIIDLRVSCLGCGWGLRFTGLPLGDGSDGPACSQNGAVAFLPATTPDRFVVLPGGLRDVAGAVARGIRRGLEGGK